MRARGLPRASAGPRVQQCVLERARRQRVRAAAPLAFEFSQAHAQCFVRRGNGRRGVQNLMGAAGLLVACPAARQRYLFGNVARWHLGAGDPRRQRRQQRHQRQHIALVVLQYLRHAGIGVTGQVAEIALRNEGARHIVDAA